MYGFAEATGALVLASLGQIASLIGLRGFAPIAAEQILSQTNQNKMEEENQDDNILTLRHMYVYLIIV